MSMPPRDERGRFTDYDEDDDDRGYSRRGYRSSRYEDDDRYYRSRRPGGWCGAPEGHAEAARRGWDSPRHGPSGWYGDPEGHGEGSRRGWDNPRHRRAVGSVILRATPTHRVGDGIIPGMVQAAGMATRRA